MKKETAFTLKSLVKRLEIAISLALFANGSRRLKNLVLQRQKIALKPMPSSNHYYLRTEPFLLEWAQLRMAAVLSKKVCAV
jgi:hypothetical protein